MKKNNKNIIEIKIDFFKTIRKIDLILSPKKLNVLLGQNGVGKTNLLKAIDSLSHNHVKSNPTIKKNRDEYKHDTFKVSISDQNVKWITKKSNGETKDEYLRNQYLSGSFLNKMSKEKKFSSQLSLNKENYYPKGNDELNEKWILKTDEVERKNEFISNIFKENKGWKTEYIGNAENLYDFQYSYNIITEYFDAENNGEEKSHSLNMIINFLENINSNNNESIKDEFIKYIDLLNSSNKEAENNDREEEVITISQEEHEEVNMASDNLEEIINGSINSFFNKYFKNIFDFKINIK